MALAVGSGKLAVSTQVRSAVLHRVVCLFQVLHSVVKRNHPCNLLPNLPAVFATQLFGLLRPGGTGDLEQDFPLGPGFAHLPGNLRREGDPPLGGRLDATFVLLIARLGWQQQHALLARFNEHLVCKDDVLMHPQRDI